MAIDLKRRTATLEALRITVRPAAHLTDRELLVIVAPDYTGPMPSDAELLRIIDAQLAKVGPTAAAQRADLPAQNRGMHMLGGQSAGGTDGNA